MLSQIRTGIRYVGQIFAGVSCDGWLLWLGQNALPVESFEELDNLDTEGVRESSQNFNGRVPNSSL